MIDRSILNDIPAEDRKTIEDLFDLILERMLKNLYLQLDEAGKKKMNDIFLSKDEKLKEDFLRSNIPDPDFAFKQEAEKVIEEIKLKANS